MSTLKETKCRLSMVNIANKEVIGWKSGSIGLEGGVWNSICGSIVHITFTEVVGQDELEEGELDDVENC